MSRRVPSKQINLTERRTKYLLLEPRDACANHGAPNFRLVLNLTKAAVGDDVGAAQVTRVV